MNSIIYRRSLLLLLIVGLSTSIKAAGGNSQANCDHSATSPLGQDALGADCSANSDQKLSPNSIMELKQKIQERGLVAEIYKKK